MVQHMELWEQVCQTDPATTKKVRHRGGFTSIDAQYQIKRATEMFGAYGSGWGMRNTQWGFSPQGGGVYMTAEFWYTFEDVTGSFDIASDMKYEVGQDVFKKLQTDCITKALSRIGFNSDVFEGMFDDNQYVEAMKEKFKDERVTFAEAEAIRKRTEAFENLIKKGEELVGGSEFAERLETLLRRKWGFVTWQDVPEPDKADCYTAILNMVRSINSAKENSEVE